ncbi:MAG: DUF3179 domain-containing (seleno)protein [Pseudomonadota bacterium]
MTWQIKYPRQIVCLALAAALLVPSAGAVAETRTPTPHAIAQFGAPPASPSGELSAEVQQGIRTALIDSLEHGAWGSEQRSALQVLAASGDPRLSWLISDAVRFAWDRERHEALTNTAAALLDIEFRTPNRWIELTNHLIAWNIPAYPGYLDHKRAIFLTFGPEWRDLFVEGDIDWRLVSWGGVPIDNRAYGTTDVPCNCIPAADNPEVSTAAEATWLGDEDIVFGIAVNGEYRAYPRRIMEVREMVNDTLGGRDLGIPYCTLCGAAQAYFTDVLPERTARPVLRTSGLLIRSNKVMYDITTYSVFDTFLGKAVTGPLAGKGVQLPQVSVVTTDWGTWKRQHPETTVLVERLALGRDFDFRNGRDANGPIFPVGDVDPRLPVHEDVIGILTAAGEPVAFQRSSAFAALKSGAEIVYQDMRLELDAGGIRAVGPDGVDLVSHEAFWFAWSQFHPGTALWTP